MLTLASVTLASVALAACFGGTGAYTVAHPGGTEPGMAEGLWHSAGGPDCTFRTMTFPLATPNVPAVDQPARPGPRYVFLEPWDLQFVSSGCQPWVQADGPFDPKYAISIYGVVGGDGDYRVGVEAPPGTYHATTPATCKWERVSRFGDRVGGDPMIFPSTIIESGTGDTVVLQPTDAGLVTEGCGAWIRQP